MQLYLHQVLFILILEIGDNFEAQKNVLAYTFFIHIIKLLKFDVITI